MTLRRVHCFASLLVFTAAHCVTGCSREHGPGTAEDTPREEAPKERPDRLELRPEALDTLRLTYARVEVRDLEPSLELPAEIVAVPDRRSSVGPRVPGRVVRVGVNVGDHVEQGAVLIVLESDEVGRARADLIAAQARDEVARRAFDRQRHLRKDQVTSQRAVEEAEGALRVAAADVQAAQTRLATFGVSTTEPAGSTPAHVVLTSPISGTVVSRSVYVGKWVERSETLVEVVDLGELWVAAAVYEREVRFVRTGQPVQVEVRAYPGEVFRGAVAQVGGTLDEHTRSLAVRVVLPNPQERLRPGMFATARIQGVHEHPPRQLLAIPWAAIQEIDEHPAVFARISDGAFEVRRIHTGERAGDLVEVLNGLAAGDEVVVDGSFLLKGQLMRASLGEEE